MNLHSKNKEYENNEIMVTKLSKNNSNNSNNEHELDRKLALDCYAGAKPDRFI